MQSDNATEPYLGADARRGHVALEGEQRRAEEADRGPAHLSAPFRFERLKLA